MKWSRSLSLLSYILLSLYLDTLTFLGVRTSLNEPRLRRNREETTLGRRSTSGTLVLLTNLNLDTRSRELLGLGVNGDAGTGTPGLCATFGRTSFLSPIFFNEVTWEVFARGSTVFVCRINLLRVHRRGFSRSFEEFIFCSIFGIKLGLMWILCTRASTSEVG